MSETRAVQTPDWDGESGERWAANLARLNRMLEAFGDAAIAAAAAKPGERVLDIGCGSGTSTIALAEKVGAHGHVLGVDISQLLIDRARADAPASFPVDFLYADAATAPLPQGSFDLVFSRFGVMFFDDPVAALLRIRQALKADGRMVFVCWRGAQENDWVRVPMTAISGIVSPAPGDPNAPGPFAFGDSNRLADLLAAAGFADIVIAPFDAEILYGQGATRAEAIDDALDMAVAVGPLSRALADQPDDIRSRAVAAVRAAFAARPGNTSVQFGGAAWIVTARNPAS